MQRLLRVRGVVPDKTCLRCFRCMKAFASSFFLTNTLLLIAHNTKPNVQVIKIFFLCQRQQFQVDENVSSRRRRTEASQICAKIPVVARKTFSVICSKKDVACSFFCWPWKSHRLTGKIPAVFRPSWDNQSPSGREQNCKTHRPLNPTPLHFCQQQICG